MPPAHTLDPPPTTATPADDQGSDPTRQRVLGRRRATGAAHPEVTPDDALADALRGYVRAVADAIGVPADGVTFEVTDTATAYLPLGRRAADHPDHDLMLVWGERRGWAVLLETPPGDEVVVLGATSGDAVVPPTEVARFVQATIASQRPGRRASGASARPDRTMLAARLRSMTPEGRR